MSVEHDLPTSFDKYNKYYPDSITEWGNALLIHVAKLDSVKKGNHGTYDLEKRTPLEGYTVANDRVEKLRISGATVGSVAIRNVQVTIFETIPSADVPARPGQEQRVKLTNFSNRSITIIPFHLRTSLAGGSSRKADVALFAPDPRRVRVRSQVAASKSIQPNALLKETVDMINSASGFQYYPKARQL